MQIRSYLDNLLWHIHAAKHHLIYGLAPWRGELRRHGKKEADRSKKKGKKNV